MSSTVTIKTLSTTLPWTLSFMFLFALFISTARRHNYPHPKIPVHPTTCSTTDRGPRCYIHLRCLFDHTFICITSVTWAWFPTVVSQMKIVQMFPFCLFPDLCSLDAIALKFLQTDCTQSSKRRNTLCTVHFANTEKTKGEEVKQINSRHIDSVSAQPL